MKLPTKKNITAYIENYVGKNLLPSVYAVMVACMEKSPSAPSYDEFVAMVREEMKPAGIVA